MAAHNHGDPSSKAPTGMVFTHSCWQNIHTHNIKITKSKNSVSKLSSYFMKTTHDYIKYVSKQTTIYREFRIFTHFNIA